LKKSKNDASNPLKAICFEYQPVSFQESEEIGDIIFGNSDSASPNKIALDERKHGQHESEAQKEQEGFEVIIKMERVEEMLTFYSFSESLSWFKSLFHQ
jgi:hypothetical protein